MFLAGVLLFTVGSLTCGLAGSAVALLIARVVQGIGAAVMTPTALSIIVTTFTEDSERNKAIGIWGALGGIGATAAWLLGGPLVNGPGWRWIFFINVPVGLAAVALAPVLLSESRATLARRSYDPLGGLTSTAAIVLVVYSVVSAPQVGWGSGQTILLLAVAAILGCGFGVIEWRHPAPLVPLRVFRFRSLVGANALTVLFGTVAYGLPVVLSLLAQQVLGYSPLKFGLSSVVLAIGATIGAIAAQGAVLKVGFRPLAVAGTAAAAGGALILAQLGVHSSCFPTIFFGLLVAGIGIGLTFVTATVAALSPVGPEDAGLASGLSNTALQIGAALGVAIVSTVAVTRSNDYLAHHPHASALLALAKGDQAAFIAVIAAVLAGTAVAAWLLGRPKAAATHEQLSPTPASTAAR